MILFFRETKVSQRPHSNFPSFNCTFSKDRDKIFLSSCGSQAGQPGSTKTKYLWTYVSMQFPNDKCVIICQIERFWDSNVDCLSGALLKLCCWEASTWPSVKKAFSNEWVHILKYKLQDRTSRYKGIVLCRKGSDYKSLRKLSFKSMFHSR